MSIFDDLVAIGKKPTIAQIGGFKPEDGLRSWFGGNFVFKDNMSWPTDNDGYMIPVIQILTSEVSNGEQFFGEAKIIQVFINSKKLPIGYAVNGDGWCLIEHDSVVGMEVVQTPENCSTYKCFQVKWSLSDMLDYPCWEESWDYVDMTEINESEELTERFFDEFDRYHRTKIGGYASYIQSPCSSEYEYVLQISSEEKPKFMVGDNGNLYILKSKIDSQWYLHWDCY
jgi:uncharacterized protein YwqG